MGQMDIIWGKFGANLGQIGPKEPNWIGVPIFIVETCPFGSSHRFDCYHHPQGMSEVILIPYQHPYGQFGAVRGYNTDLRFWL